MIGKTRNSKSLSNNLFEHIQKIPDNAIDRADRIFYSEVLHMQPNLKGYTMQHAHDAVQAIRFTRCNLTYAELLPIIKTCREFDECYAYIQQLLSNEIKRKNKEQQTSRTTNPRDDYVDRSAATVTLSSIIQPQQQEQRQPEQLGGFSGRIPMSSVIASTSTTRNARDSK